MTWSWVLLKIIVSPKTYLHDNEQWTNGELLEIFKAVDTIGYCQRLAFTVGVSQHMHKITRCENFSSIGHRSCEIIMKEK